MRYSHVNDPLPVRAARVFREEGLRACVHRAYATGFRLVVEPLQYLAFSVLHSGRRFSFAGKEYPYFIRRHNTTFRNERAVEIPICLDRVERNQGRDILEVGNVMSHYVPRDWTVVDKYEEGPGIVNADIVEHRPDRRYDLVISISTLEHVGKDEDDQDPGKASRAIAHIADRYLKPGGTFLFTVPIGYNHPMDADLFGGAVRLSEKRYLLRVSADNVWREAAADEVRDARYGEPFENANALFVGVVNG